MSIGVLDHDGLLGIFGLLTGRRLLGVVDCRDCLELVFEEAQHAGNLVSIYTDSGRHTGRIAFGFVTDPGDYVRDWQEAA